MTAGTGWVPRPQIDQLAQVERETGGRPGTPEGGTGAVVTPAPPHGPGMAAHVDGKGQAGVIAKAPYIGQVDGQRYPAGMLLQAGGAQQGPRGVHGSGSEEDAVTRFGPSRLGQAGPLSVGDVLGDGPAEGPVLGDRDVGQTLGAALLGPLLPGVEGTSGLGGPLRA